MARDALDPDPVPLTQLRNLAICRYTARNILLLRVLRWIEIAKLTKLWPQQLDEPVSHPSDVLAEHHGAAVPQADRRGPGAGYPNALALPTLRPRPEGARGDCPGPWCGLAKDNRRESDA